MSFVHRVADNQNAVSIVAVLPQVETYVVLFEYIDAKAALEVYSASGFLRQVGRLNRYLKSYDMLYPRGLSLCWLKALTCRHLQYPSLSVLRAKSASFGAISHLSRSYGVEC